MIPVYLDYAATTPVDPRVAEVLAQFLTVDGVFGNASSQQHFFGQAASDAVENARCYVARAAGCDPNSVIFTSGATESNSLAIKGIAASVKSDNKKHIITMASEHKAVLMTCKGLERSGWRITYLKPNCHGQLEIDDLESVLSSDTALVSIMHVNNETGVIQDLEKIGRVLSKSDALFHVDAAQGFGKVPFSFRSSGADLVSISAHKIYGPKGAGALLASNRARAKLNAQIEGGGQEFGFRAGTLATHQIAAFGEAARIVLDEQASDYKIVALLKSQLFEHLGAISGVTVNSPVLGSYPGIVNLSFADVDASMLLNSLSDVAMSTVSACNSGALEPSHVLRSMGIEGDRLYGAVRISFGRFTTPEQIDSAVGRIREEVERIRKNTI